MTTQQFTKKALAEITLLPVVPGAPHGTLVSKFANEIALYQNKQKRFTVVYGCQVTSNLNYSAAATELGCSILHALACDGQLDNS